MIHPTCIIKIATLSNTLPPPLIPSPHHHPVPFENPICDFLYFSPRPIQTEAYLYKHAGCHRFSLLHRGVAPLREPRRFPSPQSSEQGEHRSDRSAFLRPVSLRMSKPDKEEQAPDCEKVQASPSRRKAMQGRELFAGNKADRSESWVWHCVLRFYYCVPVIAWMHVAMVGETVHGIGHTVLP